MDGLLKEALKSLCGVGQWSYSVFWKIGCQNAKLLIWEECFYEPARSSVPLCITGLQNPEFPFGEWEGCWGSETSSELGSQPWDKVHLLINQMMMNNRFNIVGQGLVGRAAFTGNHQWIVANNYITDAQPPEVLNEVHLQFSAGMQTVAVIPVLPHGVLQLGSSTTIMENMGFVNDVKSLILHLGCIPGALFSNSYGINESVEKIGIPISLGKPISMDSAGIYRSTNSMMSVAEGCNQQSNSSQALRFIGQSPSLSKPVEENSQGASTSQLPGLTQTLAKSVDDHSESKISPEMKPYLNFKSQIDCGVVAGEVIPSNPTLWHNPQVSFCISQSGFNSQPIIGQSISSHSSLKSMEQQILSDAGVQNHVINSVSASNCQMKPKSVSGIVSNLQKQDVTSTCTRLAGSGVQNVGSSRVEVPLSILANQLNNTCMLSGASKQVHDSEDSRAELVLKKESIDNYLFQALNIPLLHADDGMPVSEQLPSAIHDCMKHESESLNTRSLNVKYKDACVQPPSGDDLFDVLGIDLKSKLLDGKWNNVLAKGPDMKMQNVGKNAPIFRDMQNVFSDIFSANEGISDRGIYSRVGTDNLLDAVVSSAQSAAKQISDDNVSCRTTLTKFSNSIPSSSPTFCQVNISNPEQKELFGGLPKSLLKGGTLPSCSYQSGCSKDDAGTCSQTTSIYGSQISSWVEQGNNSRRDSSSSTAYSKSNVEMTKPNRKRLKPGENPRPRPKDRQMIQDRVKELREIVPNGAKCSIDALLEKTIKHMLFLQSVTKHADKLKQTGESKIKENFEGGATWAFEVGSQSTICPIVVEDLNPPRQMLVEMLCEERGFFLEIADLIRGLGLTILKGIMETRNDKIWAQFAVEANRDVTRVEIFMSLVHLLEQTVKGSTSSANAFDSNNMMVQHSFAQAASIPATGNTSSLQ